MRGMVGNFIFGYVASMRPRTASSLSRPAGPGLCLPSAHPADPFPSVRKLVLGGHNRPQAKAWEWGKKFPIRTKADSGNNGNTFSYEKTRSRYKTIPTPATTMGTLRQARQSRGWANGMPRGYPKEPTSIQVAKLLSATYDFLGKSLYPY